MRDLTDYNWSPDSRWVAYAKAARTTIGVIYLYGLADRKITAVTTSASDSSAPYFDPEGKYLYFLSNRDFNEVLGVYDLEFANPKAGRVYIATLRADEPSPFPVLSDEVTATQAPDVLLDAHAGSQTPGKSRQRHPKEAEGSSAPNPKLRQPNKRPAAETEKEQKQKPGTRPPLKNFRIDLDGIQNRIVALPIPPGNLQTLTAAKGVIFYVVCSRSKGLSGPLPGEPPAIHAYDLKDRKDHVFLEGADQYALSFDGKKLLYGTPKRRGGGEGGEPVEHNYGIVDAKVPESDDSRKKASLKPLAHAGDGALKLDAMRMEIDPPAEWKQIFNEVWRQERDYFFERSMNGVNWQQEHEKYAQLLPYVADRLSLTYVLGELIGELSNSHTYVGGGDYPDIDKVNVGLLGADLGRRCKERNVSLGEDLSGRKLEWQLALSADRARRNGERGRLPAWP